MSLETAFWFLPGLVLGLTIHEAAHAVSAKWLGDCTAERMGRISLNPFKHLSALGTLALIFLGFGWGKPVLVNLYNFRKPKFYYLLSSLAGPAANLVIAAAMLGVLHLPLGPLWRRGILYAGLINLILAVVNLVPVPPLDGSKIWPCLIPGMRPTASRRWSIIWLVLLIVSLKTGAIGRLLEPVLDFGLGLVPRAKIHMAPPEAFPEILLASADVLEAYYWMEPEDGAEPNEFGACWESVEPYPANRTISTLQNRLAQAGWRRLEYLLDEPNRPGGKEWAISRDEEGSVQYHRWTEHWINDLDQVVFIELEYMIALGEEDPGNEMEVCLLLLEPCKMREELDLYKKSRPQEFTTPKSDNESSQGG